MKPLLILASLLLLPVLTLAQTSGTITDLGGGMSIYSDSQGNSGTITDLGGGLSTFSGTAGHGSVQDLGGGMSIYSFTPNQTRHIKPLPPLAPMPAPPTIDYMAPAQQLNQMNQFYMNQLNRR